MAGKPQMGSVTKRKKRSVFRFLNSRNQVEKVLMVMILLSCVCWLLNLLLKETEIAANIRVAGYVCSGAAVVSIVVWLLTYLAGRPSIGVFNEWMKRCLPSGLGREQKTVQNQRLEELQHRCAPYQMELSGIRVQVPPTREEEAQDYILRWNPDGRTSSCEIRSYPFEFRKEDDGKVAIYGKAKKLDISLNIRQPWTVYYYRGSIDRANRRVAVCFTWLG